MTKLGPICSFLNGGTPSRGVARFYQGDVPWITGADISGPRASTARSFITEEAIRESATNRVPAGTVLLVTRTSVGKVAVAAMELCFSQDITAIIPDPQCLDTSYLVHFLRTIQPHLERLARGATIKGVTRETVANLAVPLPPLDEQQRIAEILDKADALRAKRRAALAQVDILTQSIFLDMFGDPATNPKGWPTSALEGLFEISRGGSPRPINDYITESPDGVNWIMIGDAPEGSKYITATKRKIKTEGVKRSRSVKPGDFLLTNSMSFDRPYIMRTSGCIHDGWLVLSPRKSDVVPDYFYSLLGSPALYMEFSRRAPGATVKNLNIGLVRSVVVPVPPVPQQREYADRVSAIEGLTVPFQRSLGGLESLFASLQQRAFQGDL